MSGHYADHDPAQGCGLVIVACVLISAALLIVLYLAFGGLG